MSLHQVIEYHAFVMEQVRNWRFHSLPWWTGSQCDIATRRTYYA